MAQNKPAACSPTTQAASSGMPSSISSSSTYLGIPLTGGRMARSSSHESFATDVSLLSLSSFASEIPIRNRHIYDKDDEPDSDRCDQALAKYREDMLEKMLETHALTSLMNRMVNGSKSHANRSDQNRLLETISKGPDHVSPRGSNGLTKSEEELLRRCAQDEPRTKGSLYKSFSTSDVLSLNDALLYRANLTGTADSPFPMSSTSGVGQPTMPTMKSCVSQSWIPNEYARVSQRRKKHLEYLRRMCTAGSTIDDEWNMLCREDYEYGPSTGDDLSQGGAVTPDTVGATQKRASMATVSTTKTNAGSSAVETTRASSDENVQSESGHRSVLASSKQKLIKKLKLPKEISSRIRDDLMQKLSKHKMQQNVSVTRSDLEREKGRPLTRLERNFIIFHWLQSLDDDPFSNA